MITPSIENAHEPAAKTIPPKRRTMPRQRAIRWTALALVAGIVLLLGLGWMTDTLGQVIPTGKATGGATQTHAIGFDTLTLQVAPAPPRAGTDETLTFSLADATGSPIDHAQVHVTLTMSAMDMAGGSGLAQPLGGGFYRLVGGLSMGGEWTLSVDVTTPGQPTLHTTFTLAVRAA